MRSNCACRSKVQGCRLRSKVAGLRSNVAGSCCKLTVARHAPFFARARFCLEARAFEPQLTRFSPRVGDEWWLALATALAD